MEKSVFVMTAIQRFIYAVIVAVLFYIVVAKNTDCQDLFFVSPKSSADSFLNQQTHILLPIGRYLDSKGVLKKGQAVIQGFTLRYLDESGNKISVYVGEHSDYNIDTLVSYAGFGSVMSLIQFSKKPDSN